MSSSSSSYERYVESLLDKGIMTQPLFVADHWEDSGVPESTDPCTVGSSSQESCSEILDSTKIDIPLPPLVIGGQSEEEEVICLGSPQPSTSTPNVKLSDSELKAKWREIIRNHSNLAPEKKPILKRKLSFDDDEGGKKAKKTQLVSNEQNGGFSQMNKTQLTEGFFAEISEKKFMKNAKFIKYKALKIFRKNFEFCVPLKAAEALQVFLNDAYNTEKDCQQIINSDF